jgi:hypothetical protein
MADTKFVDGVEMPLSAADIAQRDADRVAWLAGAAGRATLEKISALEAAVTQRRLREAALTPEGKDWLAAQDAKIAAERAKL